MTNTTDTYWSADGVSLQTFAQNIETLGGRLAPPPLRGSNIMVPYKKGKRYTPKVVDSRIIPLAMWVRGWKTDTNTATEEFDKNWRELRNLLWTPGRQFELTKRFYIDGELRSATALAEYAGGLEPTMIGRNGAKFAVDLELADPFFYDDELQTFPLVNGNQTVNVLGDTPTTNLVLTINGARNNAKVTAEGVQVEYHADLSSGSTATLNVDDYSASTHIGAGPTFDSTGFVRHTGAPHWLALNPGDTVVNLASTSGIGTVQLQARGAWI